MGEYENGCLGLGEKKTDFILTEGLVDSLPTLYLQDEIIFQYNQGKQDRSKKSCTLFSPIGAVSSLFNIEIPLSVAKDRDSETYSKGRMKDSGRYVALGVDHITKCWNEEFGKKYGKVAYYSIDLKNDDLVQKVLSKRYSICTGFQGNAKYNNDKNDGILDGTSFGVPTYGHAIQSIRSINECPARIQDNYYGTAKFNIYDVAHKFSEISCFYEKGYVLTKVAEDNLERVKELNSFRTTLIQTIENNSSMRHQTEDKEYQKALNEMNNKNRKKLKDVENQLIILS